MLLVLLLQLQLLPLQLLQQLQLLLHGSSLLFAVQYFIYIHNNCLLFPPHKEKAQEGQA